MKQMNCKRNVIELSSYAAQIEDTQAPMSLSEIVKNLCHYGKPFSTQEDEQIITATQIAYAHYVAKAILDAKKTEQPPQLKLLCEILLNLKHIDSKIAEKCNFEDINEAIELLK